jgi:hypothetical protein
MKTAMWYGVALAGALLSSGAAAQPYIGISAVTAGVPITF